MDLFKIDSSLRKTYAERTVQYVQNVASTSPHDFTKPFTGDILSSSAWSAVIHQPAQDSEPEDLPSTVDINAIKESSASLTESVGRATYSGGEEVESSSDESESGSDNENSAAGSSSSDSDSSSQRGSSGLKSSQSSRSNTPPPCSETRDRGRKFSISADHLEDDGLKLKLSIKSRRDSCEGSDDDDDDKFARLKLTGERRRYNPNTDSDSSLERPLIQRKSDKTRKTGVNADKKGLLVRKPPFQCYLSEDSRSSEDDKGINDVKGGVRNDIKKEKESKDAKTFQPVSLPLSDQLEVINQEDLSAILKDDNQQRRKVQQQQQQQSQQQQQESDSDDMLPKKDEILRDAINSIIVTSSSSSSSSSSDSEVELCAVGKGMDTDNRKKRKTPLRKGEYSSKLLESFAHKTEILNNKSNKTCCERPTSGKNPVMEQQVQHISSSKSNKLKLSSLAEIESYMRLDCTVSNVSPDSGIQSAASPPQRRQKKATAVASKPASRHISSSKTGGNVSSKGGKNNEETTAAKKNGKIVSITGGVAKCSKIESAAKIADDNNKGCMKEKGNAAISGSADLIIRVPPYCAGKVAVADATKACSNGLKMERKGKKGRDGDGKKRKKGKKSRSSRVKRRTSHHRKRFNSSVKRKRKQRRGDCKETPHLSPEYATILEELSKSFEKMCRISKRRKTEMKVRSQVGKDRMKRRKLDKKVEVETAMTTTTTATTNNLKRKSKKIADAPKTSCADIEQRLPLKKRQYLGVRDEEAKTESAKAGKIGENFVDKTSAESDNVTEPKRASSRCSPRFPSNKDKGGEMVEVKKSARIKQKLKEEERIEKEKEKERLKMTKGKVKKMDVSKDKKLTCGKMKKVEGESDKKDDKMESWKDNKKMESFSFPDGNNKKGDNKSQKEAKVAPPTPTKSPQLITPIPDDPPAAHSPSKPPAGVFEPSGEAAAKTPSKTAKKSCGRNIADVLSKLTEKLKGWAAPVEGKVEQERKKMEERTLRPKRAMELDQEEAVKKKKAKEKGDKACKMEKEERLESKQKLELAKERVVEDKELKGKEKKIKRKINRTGFPVTKKKKKKEARLVTATNVVEQADELGYEIAGKGKMEESLNISKEADVRVMKKSEVELTDKDGALASCHGKSILPVKLEEDSENVKKNDPDDKKPTQVMGKALEDCKGVRSSARIHTKKTTMMTTKDEEAKADVTKGEDAKAQEENSSKTAGKKRKAEGGKEKEVSDKKRKLKAAEGGCHSNNLSAASKAVEKGGKKAGSIKRNYLPAGLFSCYYKQEKKYGSVLPDKSRKEEVVDVVLPKPAYCDDYVRGRRKNFKLPYDIWCQHVRSKNNNKLPPKKDGNSVIESWNFKKIRTNVYNDFKPTNTCEAQACNCKMPEERGKMGCGEDCINRLVYVECSPETCPLKERCSNQKIQKHEWASGITKYMTKDKGWGMKTTEAIKAGEYILEYVGEVVSEKEFRRRMTDVYKNDIHHYCLNLDKGSLIDSQRVGSDCRFVNHSCEPNCEMQKWSVNGLFRMALFAMRDIKPGEELTYDYNFSPFNADEGQPCKCGSGNCRGVIGGKSQRVATKESVQNVDNCGNGNGNDSDKKIQKSSRKTSRKPTSIPVGGGGNGKKRVHATIINIANKNKRMISGGKNLHLPAVKELTPEEKKVVVKYRVFLPRNLNKIEKMRLKHEMMQKAESCAGKSNEVFLTQLTALSTQRLITTRRLAQAQDDPEVTKTVQLAKVLQELFAEVISAKDEKGEPLSALFMNLPSKKKLPIYYQRIGEPIDLSSIERNIQTGIYKGPEAMDKDFNKLFTNSVKYYGRTSEDGIAAIRLRKEYNISKMKYAGQLEEITQCPLPKNFIPPPGEDPGDEEEDVIRCICGLYNDEGLMIQCERCLIWQHGDCVKADNETEHYMCERCNPRDVDYEIPLDEAPDYAKQGEKHYLTLMRADLQIRQGDTVYVLRDILNPDTGTRHNYTTIKGFKFEDCDIFRVERLWKNEETGERMSFGHHYLRPHETFHEPTRKFYHNEVVKVSLYESVPLDLIMGRCYVMDSTTYCRGRPMDSDMQHVYICDFRVDKAARLFYKMPKSKQPPICTKNYAFEEYEKRLKISRLYAPHGEFTPQQSKQSSAGKTGKSATASKKASASSSSSSSSSAALLNEATCNGRSESCTPQPPCSEDGSEPGMEGGKGGSFAFQGKRRRLNGILLKLMTAKKKSGGKQSCGGVLDASYLLDAGRRNRHKKSDKS